MWLGVHKFVYVEFLVLMVPSYGIWTLLFTYLSIAMLLIKVVYHNFIIT